jgi:hypothetical protein
VSDEFEDLPSGVKAMSLSRCDLLSQSCPNEPGESLRLTSYNAPRKPIFIHTIIIYIVTGITTRD